MSIIGDNFKKARKAAELSQEQSAKLLAVKRSRVGAWEEGRSAPPLNILPKIIQLFNITDWAGFIMQVDWDPKKQKAGKQVISLIEERYKKLPKKLQRVADELLNLA